MYELVGLVVGTLVPLFMWGWIAAGGLALAFALVRVIYYLLGYNVSITERSD